MVPFGAADLNVLCGLALAFRSASWRAKSAWTGLRPTWRLIRKSAVEGSAKGDQLTASWVCWRACARRARRRASARQAICSPRHSPALAYQAQDGGTAGCSWWGSSALWETGGSVGREKMLPRKRPPWGPERAWMRGEREDAPHPRAAIFHRTISSPSSADQIPASVP